jgi:hypothetical protein
VTATAQATTVQAGPLPLADSSQLQEVSRAGERPQPRARSRLFRSNAAALKPRIGAEGAREAAKKTTREADRAEAEARSMRMGTARPRSPEVAQCLNSGYGWLQVKCRAAT